MRMVSLEKQIIIFYSKAEQVFIYVYLVTPTVRSSSSLCSSWGAVFL